MRTISVTAPDRGVIGGISLSGGVTGLVGAAAPRSWGRRFHLTAAAEDRLELSGMGPYEDPMGVLTDLQNGLLFTEIAGMRLAPDPDPALLRHASAHCGLAELIGPDGGGGILALWDGPMRPLEAARLAGRDRLVAFTLTRLGRGTGARSRLSVLVPEGEEARTLELVTLLQIARAQPLVLRERRAPPREIARAEWSGAARAVPDWVRPGPDQLPDRRRETDRIALSVCAEIRSGRALNQLRKIRLIHDALRTCWALDCRRATPPTAVNQHLREISVVIELVTREERHRGELAPLRGLVRAFGLIAWGAGHAGKRGAGRDLSPGFSEEACEQMHPLPQEAREYLMELHLGETDRPVGTGAIDELAKRGLIDPFRVLTNEGRALAGAQIAWDGAERPSIRSLLDPDADLWALVPAPPSVEPERDESVADWVGPGPDWAPDPRLEVDRAALHVRTRISLRRVMGRTVVAKLALSALLDCWRLGAGDKKRVSHGVTDQLRELAYALERVTRPDRDRGELSPVRDLLRALGLISWGLGLIYRKTGEQKAPPRFSEAACDTMRPVPPAAREYLVSLHQGGVGEPVGSGVIGALTDLGLLDPAGALTDQGRAVAEAQLAWVAAAPVSLRSLLDPEADLWALVPIPPRRPRKPKAKRRDRHPDPKRDEADLDPLLSRLDELPVAPPDPNGSDPFPAQAAGILGDFFRVGRDGPAAAHRRGFVTAPYGPFIAERARAIAEATRADRARGEMAGARELIRTFAPEMWGHGVQAARGVLKAPPPRFREECSVAMRPVPLTARQPLVTLQEGGRPRLGRKLAAALTRSGLLRAGVGLRLTEKGQAVVREERSTRASSLPSLLSLIDPAPPPDPIAESSPPDGAAMGAIGALAADDCARFRPGRGSEDRFRALISGTLLLCWRMGNGPEEQARPPERVIQLVRERARVIELLTRTDRRARELTRTEALLRGCASEMWAYGAVMRDAPGAALPARYREECSEPMRPVPVTHRDRLISLLGNRSGRPMLERNIAELVEAGVTGPDGRTLTAAGYFAARTELAHRKRDLPSILALTEPSPPP